MPEKKKIDEELKISVPLENFNYSGTKKDVNEKNSTSNFFGRAKEKDRLLDHLIRGKNRSRSFLIAGYRGVGKTRFVSEVLCDYGKEDSDFIGVRVNLGNDGDLSSKVVLFNMVYLLNNALRRTRWIKILRPFFGNFIHGLSFAIVFLALFDLSISAFNFGYIFYDFSHWIIPPVLFCVAFWVLMHYGKFPCPRSWKAFVKLKDLQREIYSATNDHVQIKSNFFDFGKRRIAGPLTTNQIEAQLKAILKILKDDDVIFIFDELDKLSGRAPDKKDANLDLVKESKFRKEQVDSILGDLKNLITDSDARYIFIAGRDMYDAYLSERGSSNSLYESLFNAHIYIPSLLTDRSDGEIYLLDSMIEAFVVSNLMSEKTVQKILKEKANNHNCSGCKFSGNFSLLKLSDYVSNERNKEIGGLKSSMMALIKRLIYFDKYGKELETRINKELEDRLLKEVYILKTLIHFLTLHSWGNCKRLFTLFESFVRKENDSYQLHFSTRDVQRLILSSQLYILFHHNLSRILMNADDKLVVSSFSIFHYILKYHGMGFSREHILRMYETINIHSSPELIRIVDIIIHNVLLNHVRKIRNGLYQYRFTFLHEREIHFITTINDGESAVFNFSLNAMDAVKQHYKNLIVESKHTHTEERYGHITLASIHVIVGDFHFWEQSFDEASIHYGIALDILEKNGGLTEEIERLDLSIQMVEIFMKLGAVDEKVGNYTAAATAYLNAERLADSCLKVLGGRKLKSKFSIGLTRANDSKWDVNFDDPKWDVMRQPRWARLFLNLKQGDIPSKDIDFKGLLRGEDSLEVSKYKEAVLLFFMEKFELASHAFFDAAELLSSDKERKYEYDSERTCFLKGNSYLKSGFSMFLEYSIELYKELHDASEINVSQKRVIEINVNEIGSLLETFGKLVTDAFDKIDDDHFSLSKNESELLKEVTKDRSKKITDPGVMSRIIRLLNLSALSFQQGKLNFNAAMSYLCMVMIWQAFLELIPWEKNNDESWSEIPKIGDNIDALKKIYAGREKSENQSWILEAQRQAFEFFASNTGEAYHHFMKSVLERNLDIDGVPKESYFGREEQRERILKNEHLLFQHFSLFGQVVAATIYWEQMSVNYVAKEIKRNDDLAILKGIENDLLPYGIRYYSMMLWLKGRKCLGDFLNSKESSKEESEITAVNAIVNLFRSSQYIIKTHGEASNMILPPLFMIYYNMWEVLFHLVGQVQVSKKQSFEQAVYGVRFSLTERLKEANIKDISSRMLDLESVKSMAQEQFRIAERMGDLSSISRTSALKNKYYLDDDYEDNMFILDWSYCRFFTPGAMLHRKIMEYRMEWLKKKFEVGV